MIFSLMFFDVAFGFYVAAAISYAAYSLFRKEWIGYNSTLLFFLGFLSNIATLTARTVEVHHAPFSNLYESMIFFSAIVALIYLILEFRYKTKMFGVFLSVFLSLSFFVTNLLPFRMKVYENLNPALQSYWLEIHVATMFVGYSAFAISFIAAVLYLAKSEWHNGLMLKYLPNASVLDNLSYKSIAWGMPFLTVGIATGAVWANYTWGSYWSWDPKETWSLITWLIYAAYLHARITRGWKDKKAAILAIAGFLSMAFLYWGVSFVLPGLHSYGRA
ncbi:MAG: c-type cytochrome biogenesis protein CcsB [Epsilonproteobacteria bacterium]|nr:c-type cytochrome biogenesis protein CcsB [Campylobacterota bacterium]